MKTIIWFFIIIIPFTLAACEENSTQINKISLNNEVDYMRIRTDQKHFETPPNESIEVIRSKEALEDYLDAHAQDYYFNRGFKVAVIPYDTAFFETQTLILISLHETSGSTTHQLDTLYIENDILHVEVIRNVSNGTADMAAWHLLIEYDNSLDNIKDTKLTITK